MLTLRVSTFLGLFATLLAAQGTLADYERSIGLRGRLEPLLAGTVADIRWIGKTGTFSYSRRTVEGVEYLISDSGGNRKPAFDHKRLAEALAKATGQKVDAAKLNLVGLNVLENGKGIEFRRGDDAWFADLAEYKVNRNPQRAQFGRGPRVPELERPVASPDGKHEVFLRNYNIWLRAKAGEEKPVALSTDGSEGNYYALSANAWSPDGKKVAVYRIRPGQRRQIHMVESSPADQVQPKLKSIPYVKPGDALDLPRPVFFDVASRKQMEVDNALFANPYTMSEIQWRKDSRALHFNYNQRGHQVYRIIEVNAETGSPRAVVEETSPTFFCYYSKLFRRDIADGREVIWASERDGWNHLYLYDGVSGRVKNQITKGEWVVRSVAAVDEDKRELYFVASGMDAGKDPHLRHLFRVKFDGSGLTRLTKEEGDHHVIVSPDFQFFTDAYSRVDLAPVTALRRTSEGTLVTELGKVDGEAIAGTGWRAPEVLKAKARDGKTDIWGVLFRPSNFDASRKYPVLEYIYAGPQDSFVPKTFTPSHPMQAMAELGFVVVQMDGMGTSNRAKAFHDVSWRNIGDAGFPDRILWHKAAAAKYPWYDLDRVGIYGHSAGGQNSLGALLLHGDFYKAAASSAGCHDNRMDKMSWNEQWMSWPVGPEYAASSNVEHAHKLKGKLLLAVGELDENVDPASTMQVVNALIKAGKMFDLLVVPGAGHGLPPYYERKRSDFFVRNLLGVEPPDWNVVKAPEPEPR